MKDKALHALSLLAAVLIVGGGLYLVLDKAVPIVAFHPEAVQPVPATGTVSASTAEDRPTARIPQRAGSSIYRCQRNGSVVYSDTPCEGGHVVDVQVTQGFEAERHRPAARPIETVSAPATAAPAPQRPDETNAAICEQIHRAIEGLDAAARSGGSIEYMEDLKERRRKLVERRQELRC